MSDFDVTARWTAMMGPNDPSSIHHPSSKPVKAESQEQIERACRDFESLFINQMLKQMRQTVPQDGLFSGGNGEKMYTSMLDGELSKNIAQQRGIGLAPALIRQMTELAGMKEK